MTPIPNPWIPDSAAVPSADPDTIATLTPHADVAVGPISSVNTAGTEASASGERYSEGRLQRELPSPRLCRESGGVAPTAQMTQADGRKRAEVQGSAPSAEEGGRPSTDFAEPPSNEKEGQEAPAVTQSAQAAGLLEREDCIPELFSVYAIRESMVKVSPPLRFVLDKTAFMEAIEPAPAFLSAPSPEYLEAADLMPVLAVLAGYR